jgi:hypothetical protein
MLRSGLIETDAEALRAERLKSSAAASSCRPSRSGDGGRPVLLLIISSKYEKNGRLSSIAPKESETARGVLCIQVVE